MKTKKTKRTKRTKHTEVIVLVQLKNSSGNISDNAFRVIDHCIPTSRKSAHCAIGRVMDILDKSEIREKVLCAGINVYHYINAN